MKNIDKEYFKNIEEKYPISFACFVTFLGNHNGTQHFLFKLSQKLDVTFLDIPFELQVGFLMAFVEGYVTNGQLGQCPAAFLLSDGFNVEGIKLNLTRIFARIENNLL